VSLPYGFVKSKIASAPALKAKRMRSETQYHEHVGVTVDGVAWDVAINVGTNDADDLLQYKLVFDFHHSILATLSAAGAGKSDLTDLNHLPALDFQRSDILAETGDWRDSDVTDGSDFPEPIASLKRLLISAQENRWDVYVFGRFYSEGDGIHDVHMNQGSTSGFVHRDGDDSNDHNDVWQDGAVMVDRGDAGWAAYMARFKQQLTPTDQLGNPVN
jgi:uncharacterized protein YukJ